MNLSLLIANLSLGIFVGALAYAPIAPAERARSAFLRAWYFGLAFVGLSFFDQLTREASYAEDGQLIVVLVGLLIGLPLNRALGLSKAASAASIQQPAAASAPTSTAPAAAQDAPPRSGDGAATEAPMSAPSTAQRGKGKGKGKGNKRRRR